MFLPTVCQKTSGWYVDHYCNISRNCQCVWTYIRTRECKVEISSSIPFDPYECYLDLCNQSCSCGQPAVYLAWQKLGHCAQTFQPNFFHTCYAYRFYHSILLSLTLTLAGGHRTSNKSKLLGFIFSHTFQLISIKFCMVLKQCKSNMLILLLSEIEWKKGKITAVLLTSSKNL